MSLYYASRNSDIFIAKYSSAGRLIWVRRAGGAGADVGSGIGLDSSGNCYVSGGYASTIANFDGVTITNAGGSDFFLAK
jgi:Beta-propeller repeat